MTPEKLLLLVLEVLQEVQKMSGRRWQPLTPDMKPIGTLDGFDSLAGVEATVMIEEKLKCTLDVESLFVSEDGKQALTLKQVCERIATIVAATKASA
jgi:acyl carrier protein